MLDWFARQANALPYGVPDGAAEGGAPVQRRYPALYLSRRGVVRAILSSTQPRSRLTVLAGVVAQEDVDEIADPELFHPNGA